LIVDLPLKGQVCSRDSANDPALTFPFQGEGKAQSSERFVSDEIFSHQQDVGALWMSAMLP
jgi:hypothetical protein